MSLDKIAQRAKVVPEVIRLPLVLISVALTAFWIFTDSGVFAWISDLQATIFDGSYYPVLSGIITFLIAVLPAGIIIQIIAAVKISKQKVAEEKENL